MIAAAGKKSAKRFLEFFTAEIRNANTRRAYGRAAAGFFAWIDQRQLTLPSIGPIHVASWVESLKGHYDVLSVKQQLAAVRMLFDYLVTGGTLPHNPTSSVRGPRHSIRRGKTPILDAKEAGRLLDSIPTDHIVGLRDRALIALMTYTFAARRSICASKMFSASATASWFVCARKAASAMKCPAIIGWKIISPPISTRPGSRATKPLPLFRTIDRKTRNLSKRPLAQPDVWSMVNRRAKAAGISTAVCNHTFRGTGITAYLENGGMLERARDMANHASTRTTQLYDRRNDSATLEDVERIRLS
jgi:site-specific recombinase XerD